VGFDSTNPLLPNYARLINGLQNQENIVALDARVSDGKILVLATTPAGAATSHTSIYTLDPSTGNLTTAISQLTPDLDKSSSTTEFGFDVDPVDGTGRIVSTGAQNLVINTATQLTIPALPVFYGPTDTHFGATPDITSIAYNDNVSGATSTTLYGIDASLGTLATIAGDTGVMSTVGSLNISNITHAAGFDVSTSGNAYAVISPFMTIQVLYQINLETGAATPVGLASLGILNLQGLTAASTSSSSTSVAGK
jgi:hypothetical protein